MWLFYLFKYPYSAWDCTIYTAKNCHWTSLLFILNNVVEPESCVTMLKMLLLTLNSDNVHSTLLFNSVIINLKQASLRQFLKLTLFLLLKLLIAWSHDEVPVLAQVEISSLLGLLFWYNSFLISSFSRIHQFSSDVERYRKFWLSARDRRPCWSSQSFALPHTEWEKVVE